MSDVVQSIRELPTWVKVLVALGVGFFVLIPVLVVLSAVVGAFVLSVGSSADMAETPQVEFTASYDETADELTVRHAAGDSFASGDVEVVINGETQPWPGVGKVTQGDSVTISNVQPGDTVEIVWENSDGAGMTLFRYDV